MDTYEILILPSGLVIFSYLFDIFSRRTKVPAVLLLLATGMVLRILADAFHFKGIDFSTILPLLGTIGLISTLLLFSLPESNKLIGIDGSLHLFVILATGLVMTFGLIRTKHDA